MTYRNVILVFTIMLLTVVNGCASNSTSSGKPPDLVIEESVTIYRDNYGVPHINGISSRAVMYGLGYAQAEDHLEEMITWYLKAAGRLSEYKGPGIADINLNSDMMVRLLNVHKVAEDYYNNMIDDNTMKYLKAFTDGINQYINEQPQEKLSWINDYRPSPADVLALIRYDAIMQEVTIAEQKIRNLSVQGCPSLIPESTGSNGWVIGKKLSENGTPILQADPHQFWCDDGISCRTQWYEASLDGGDFHVAGATYFGTPMILIGHNENIAWTLTNNGVDNADVYEETARINTSGQYEYLYDGIWLPVIKFTEEIDILNSKPLTIEMYYTHHGAVVPDAFFKSNDPSKIYSVRLTTNDDFADPAKPFFLIDKSKNLSDFKAALSNLDVAKWNMLYGDTDGNIFYVNNARLPKRSSAVECWTKPLDGTIKATEWEGLLPFSELPKIENPVTDYLQINNVPPWDVTKGFAETDFSYYPGLFEKGRRQNYRGQMIRNLFDSKEGTFSEKEIRGIYENPDPTQQPMSIEVYSAKFFIPMLEASYSGITISDTDEKEALNTMNSWDRFATAKFDNYGMLLYNQWIIRLLAIDGTIEYLSPPLPDLLTEGQKKNMRTAFKETVSFLRDKYGTALKGWGEVHTLKRSKEPVNKRRPLNGAGYDIGTTLKMTTSEGEYGIGDAIGGSSFIMLTVLEKGNVHSYNMKPFGQNQNADSVHYADLSDLFVKDQYKAMLFFNEEVKLHAESQKTFRLLPQ